MQVAQVVQILEYSEALKYSDQYGPMSYPPIN